MLMLSNTITFELRNSSGVVLDDTTLNVVSGPQRIPLNLEVPIGSDFQLGITSVIQVYIEITIKEIYLHILIILRLLINITSSSWIQWSRYWILLFLL